eukprot:7170034-Prorocentrum_lima.AAC.1
MLPTLGALRGMWGMQIVSVQSDNGGEFINEQLISTRSSHEPDPSIPTTVEWTYSENGGHRQGAHEESVAWI